MIRPMILAMILSTVMCTGDDSGPPLADEATAFVVGTDFFTGGVASTIHIPLLEVTQNAIDGVASTDPVVRRLDDRVFIINRFGANNVTIIDAETNLLIDQISTGAGSNPQDVAVVDQLIFVAAMGTAGVLILDSQRPNDGVVGMVDLSLLDPDDGIPNCSSIVYVDNKLIVVCGILDDTDQFFTPRGPGMVAVIDASDHTLLDSFALSNANPFGFLQKTEFSGLLIATLPNFADLTEGCLEQITLGGSPASGGCLVQNSDLGGYAASYIPTIDNDAVTIAVTVGFNTDDFGPEGSIRVFDLVLGELEPQSLTPDYQRPFELALCPTGHLVVADAIGGVRVYDAAGLELTTEVIDIGMPPVSKGLVCY